MAKITNQKEGGKYTLNAYLVLLKTNKNKRLLVEGKDDKRLLRTLNFQLWNKALKKPSKNELRIDVVSELIKSKKDCKDSKQEGLEGLGEREKVEKICKLIEHENCASWVVGFVDREFRGFEFSNEILDNIENHHIDKQIVWSRGHSVENYFFDADIICNSFISRVLSSHLDSDETWLYDTINLFQRHFKQAIVIACTIGMVASELKKIKRIQKSIDWNMFVLSKNNFSIQLDLEKWGQKLVSGRGLSLDEVEEITNAYICWLEKLKDLDFELVRWLCHGHIGYHCIQNLFYKCVSITSYSHSEPRSCTGNLDDIQYFGICCEKWVQRIIDGEHDHPLKPVRNELGLDPL